MLFANKALPLSIVAAAMLAACSDASSPTSAISAPAAPLAKGGVSGGGTSGGSKGTVQLVVTTPPTENATGTWIGTTDGPDVVHTYTLTLTQTAAGSVSGVSSYKTPFQNGFEVVIGTVNGDTLALYGGPGAVSPGAQLSLLYRGIISGSRIDGAFVGGVSPTFFKQ